VTVDPPDGDLWELAGSGDARRIALIAVDRKGGPLPPGIAVAYDAAGHEVGTWKVFS
jgi:hypothetical protein